MMDDVKAVRQLYDGARLELVEYKLSNEESCELGRPAGSFERCLRLHHEGKTISTNPRASWHLQAADFTQMFDMINYGTEFNVASHYLDKYAHTHKFDVFLRLLLRGPARN